MINATPAQRKWLAAFVSLACVFAANPVVPGNQDDTGRKLNALKENITQLQSWLAEAKNQRSGILSKLRDSELAIGNIAKKIGATAREIQATRTKLVQLKAQRNSLTAAKRRQADYLAQQIRTAYSIGRQEFIKVLLNQEHPERIARTLQYYDYFNRARTDQIEAYSKTITQLRENEVLIDHQNLKLHDFKSKLEEKRAALRTEKNQRQQVLLKLESSIDNKDQELEKLLSDRKQLEELLEAVEQSLANIKLPEAALPIQQLKGRLQWPTTGNLIRRFGSRNSLTGDRWKGVLIDATEGRDVLAIHHGRVIFADWLRGFGLLTIIDHGGGYMSLYGHNQTLYKDVGDWVQPNETIASVGNSGGQTQTGLYFEIRHNGKPQDPQQWVARTKPNQG